MVAPENNDPPAQDPAELLRAAPDTLLGMIQRGRGASRARARSNRQAAATHVVDCIVHDPRWDHQVESRAWLYATLVTDLGIDLADLRPAYSSPHDPRGDSDAWIVTGVFECLAQRGIPGAITELRRYLATGRDPHVAMGHLLPFVDHPEAEGLHDDLLAIVDDEELTYLLRSSWQFPDLSAHPWLTWRQSSPRTERAALAVEREQAESKRDRPGAAARNVRLRDRAVRFAVEAGYLTAAEARSLGDERWTRFLLDIASVRLTDRELPREVRIWLRRQFRELRSPDALTWARTSLSPGGDQHDDALSMLARIGESTDAPMLFDHMISAAAAGDEGIGDLCDIVPALGRLTYAPARSPIEEIFVSTPYSYLRERCAGALSTLAADFPVRYAIECLDDCESGTREIGIAHADLSNPEVHERIKSIATDASEELETRRAAVTRIERDV
ncbi:hypothetical protein [Nocardia sp. NPDC057668]|uniref:hypothetical protein n=1 Tax=Nocardia sp. NPDC057668 TaxID=3346202 RepID=UPI0036722680